MCFDAYMPPEVNIDAIMPEELSKSWVFATVSSPALETFSAVDDPTFSMPEAVVLPILKHPVLSMRIRSARVPSLVVHHNIPQFSCEPVSDAAYPIIVDHVTCEGRVLEVNMIPCIAGVEALSEVVKLLTRTIEPLLYDVEGVLLVKYPCEVMTFFAFVLFALAPTVKSPYILAGDVVPDVPTFNV
jgi:hypothetical protein